MMRSEGGLGAVRMTVGITMLLYDHWGGGTVSGRLEGARESFLKNHDNPNDDDQKMVDGSVYLNTAFLLDVLDFYLPAR